MSGSDGQSGGQRGGSRVSGALAGIRIVASDLDGTLLRTDGTISDRTVQALRDAVAAGIDVTFVTGRPYRYLGYVLERTAISGPVICGNGALVWDPGRAEPVLVRGFAPGEVRSVVQRIRDALPGVAFAVEQVRGLSHEHHYEPRLAAPGTRRVVLEDALGEPVLKLLVRGPDDDLDRLRTTVTAAVHGRAEVTYSSTYDEPLLELSAPGVDKGSALAAHAGALGVPAAQVLAVGDMPNDVSMLRWAGIGVAVAGAHRDALAAADRTTAGNDEDGVAQLVEEVLAAQR